MSGNFLPAARKLVFLGEAGCGKSEIAMQLALTLAAQGGAVHFFDLDQTKPLLRARDAAALLEAGGVTVHFAEQYADIPTQTGGLLPLLMDESAVVLLDVGGGDTGAKLIGGYAHLLRTAAVYFVVNPYRPWSGTAAHIDGTLSAVLRASRLRTPCMRRCGLTPACRCCASHPASPSRRWDWTNRRRNNSCRKSPSAQRAAKAAATA